MFAKASTILAVFAVAARVVVAAPPACLLAAVNTCDNPADIKAICSDESTKVTSYISEKCGSQEDAATKWFKEVCEDAGETISGGNSTSSSSSSSTATSSGSSKTKTASASGMLPSASGYSNSNSNSTDSSSTITGASTFATGVSGAASASGTGYGSNSNNGTVLSTAGTAGPTTAGNAGTSPTGAAGSASSGTASEGAASRMSMEFVGLAAIGVVGAMLAL